MTTSPPTTTTNMSPIILRIPRALVANPNPRPNTVSRKDPDLWEIFETVQDSTKFKKFLIDHGLMTAGSDGQGAGANLGFTKTGKPILAVCSSLPFNQKKPQCAGNVCHRLKEGRDVFSCTSCGSSRSVFHGNSVLGGTGSKSFFSYVDSMGRINRRASPESVLIMMYMLCYDVTVTQIQRLFGSTHSISRTTLIDWQTYIREVMQREMADAPLMGGPGSVIQVDECSMQGKKNNRGHRITGNLNMDNGTRRNIDQNKSEGPWLFGLHDPVTKETRFFWLKDRKAATLNYYIAQNCARGTTIHSDNWKGYSDVSQLGMVHKTVDSKKFVAADGTHIQGVKRAWVGIKSRLIKIAGGSSSEAMAGHCAFHWWLSTNGAHKCADPFLRLIQLLGKYYPQ